MTAPTAAQRTRIVAEAIRLRALGYRWDDALNVAELIVILADAGIQTVVSDEYEHCWRNA